jgi:ribosome-associated toxin RatA of RatAB toxin-antitoxin module/CRP-like cAMP-binding protein
LELRRSVLVPYSAEGMFDLIEHAEDYPKFLPWCVAATILERSDDWVAARIDFSYLGVRFGFQTRNPKRRPEWLKVRMVDGPFRHFHADWTLRPLGQQGCKIEFELSYEVADGMLDRVAARAVDLVSRSMVDAFVQRADKTLGILAAPTAQAAVSPPQLTENSTTTSERSPMNTIDPQFLETVRKSPLAQDMSADEAAVLAGVLSLQSLPAKQVLAREGSSDNRLYAVVSGSLAIVKSLGTPDEEPILTLNAGEFAHELGFLDGAERYASLVAASDAQVLVLEREQLESLIDTHPRVLYRAMCAIVRAVHRVQARQSMHASELSNYISKQHGRY